MKCPRGNHGKMVLETWPIVHRCLVCGNMIYPGYKDNVAEDPGTGARPHMSPKQKQQRDKIIADLHEREYTNAEIGELTGYTKSIIATAARVARKAIAAQRA